MTIWEKRGKKLGWRVELALLRRLKIEKDIEDTAGIEVEIEVDITGIVTDTIEVVAEVKVIAKVRAVMIAKAQKRTKRKIIAKEKVEVVHDQSIAAARAVARVAVRVVVRRESINHIAITTIIKEMFVLRNLLC